MSVVAEKIWCTLLVSFVLLGDTVHLIYPLSELKRPDVSQVKTLFGPLCGIADMDKVNAMLVGAMLIPAGYLSWLSYSSSVAALVSCLGLAAAQPYLLFVAYYASSTASRPLTSPLGAVAASVSLGLYSLTYRVALDGDNYGLNPLQVPVIVFWHAICSVVALGYRTRVKARLPSLRATIELERIKRRAAVSDGAPWPRDARSPEGVEEAYPDLVDRSREELDAVVYTPPELLAGACSGLVLFLLVSSVLCSKQQGPGSSALFRFVTFPLMILETFVAVMKIFDNHSSVAEDDGDRARSVQVTDDESSKNNNGNIYQPPETI